MSIIQKSVKIIGTVCATMNNVKINEIKINFYSIKNKKLRNKFNKEV